jgi:hypothetical protein
MKRGAGEVVADEIAGVPFHIHKIKSPLKVQTG